jgi:CobQ-like glutamine amidotransferase family enzyme
LSGLLLRVAHLYPRLMNIYGDRGNIMCLRRRSELRGISFEVRELSMGDAFDATAYDLVFAGGAQDREQRVVTADLLATKAPALRQAVEDGVALLAVCGAYQLFGRYYRDATGAELPGAGIFDLHTEHPGKGMKRCIGNQGGRTRLGPGVQPLGRVRSGRGNNGEDGTEGAVYRNAIGTYVHGSLLPKNPVLADHILALALRRRYGDIELAPLDDRAEERAHAAALQLRQ